ncbi:MAG TPA: formyltetrahydrofolate deformylase, partial [Candidatus Omnitrophota bacterium]|nr:formyltetrahydrofolate deformylase [Candidatus Omnitrophota bacterium]
MTHAVLLISCPDQRGITAAVSNFIFAHNGNIVHADQHIDEQTNTFFMRIEWSLEGFDIPEDRIPDVFREVAGRFSMIWDLSLTSRRPKMAVFVSKPLHCLQDILLRHKAGQFRCDIPVVVSNHPDARPVAEAYKIDFHEFPVSPATKRSQEEREIEVLTAAGVDFIFLARYHQILTGEFVRRFSDRIINIHHSFLPAFAGKNPYAQAYEKGVKIIGATCHYVTETLDEGPIIEQAVERVGHSHS